MDFSGNKLGFTKVDQLNRMIKKEVSIMTVCTIAKVEYARFKRRKIGAEFTDGGITSA